MSLNRKSMHSLYNKLLVGTGNSDQYTQKMVSLKEALIHRVFAKRFEKEVIR